MRSQHLPFVQPSPEEQEGVHCFSINWRFQNKSFGHSAYHFFSKAEYKGMALEAVKADDAQRK